MNIQTLLVYMYFKTRYVFNSSHIIYMIQCSKCRMQNISETKRHLSNRFGANRHATKKAINHCHIDQSPANSDHFILQAIWLRHRTHSHWANKLSQRHHSQSQRSFFNYQQQYSWMTWNKRHKTQSVFYLYIFSIIFILFAPQFLFYVSSF